MGAKNDWSNLKGRVAGKWQIPLLAVALALFAATIYRTRPEAPAAPFKAALAGVDVHISARRFSDAIREARELAARAELSALERAKVELRIGRARFGALHASSPPNSRVASQIARHFEADSPDLESLLTSDDFVALGRLMQWQGQHESAIAQFEKAIELSHTQADDLLKEIYVIHRDRLKEEPARLTQRLDELLSKIGAHRLDVRIWRLEEKVNLADQMGNYDDLEAALRGEVGAFEESDYLPQFEFLQCRLLVATRREKEAENRLRALRNQVDESSEVSARAGWLLGTILLSRETTAKWNEAQSFFSDVLQRHSNGPYAVASRVGQGAALARLNRHEEAIATYAKAVKQLASIEDNRVVSLPALRGSLAVTAETLRQKGDLHNAVEYAALAVRLTDTEESAEKTLYVQPLALLEEQLAEEISATSHPEAKGVVPDTVIDARYLAQPKDAAALYESAASHFDALAKLNVYDESRSAEFSWKAAELYTKGGAFDEASRRYREFVSQRPENHRGPTALLRVGQLHYARGELKPAVEAFQECHRRFPRSFDGARALVPMARAYLAMGRDRFGDAEQALRLVLDDSDVFTPSAGEFVEGLFLLGDVLERDERYEPAISALQEALDRYPDDPRVPRGRFLLGGAYRKSALAMRVQSRETQSAADLERIRTESAHRLREARTVYRELIVDLEYRPLPELDEREQMYLQHSYLYEADCYFETQEYADALKLYEQAAGNLRDSARGLSAHVQMINCQVFLGRMREARAALARAMVVVEAMPESAFVNRVSPESRGEWKAYFQWLGQSELF